jgi:hypothetical protein
VNLDDVVMYLTRAIHDHAANWSKVTVTKNGRQREIEVRALGTLVNGK